MSNKILSLDHLKIGYISGKKQNPLLPPVTASARRGELIAVIGKNGVGKSTLLRTLAGLQQPLAGNISCYGKNLNSYSRRDLARTIGYISTDIVRVTNMRVYDLVALGRFVYTNWFGRIDEMNNRIITESILKTGISGLAGRFISELSDGERQKAMIARILAQDTEIMIMDEPTAFLDVGSKFEILHLMHLLSGKNGKTIIFSTHDLNVALSQADKIWLIVNNRMMEGAPEDLMMAGAFDHLFDSSSVEFNSDLGTYSLISENRGVINVSGSGINLGYAKKAISRAGFSASECAEDPYLQTPSGNNGKWLFIRGGETDEFESLYDFVAWISAGPGDPA